MRFISGATVLGLWMLGAGSMVPAFAADPPASPPRFEVSGILLQDDGKSWALIAEPQWTGGTVRLFSPGAMIGPYRLVEVQRDHVVLGLSSEAPFRVPYSWRGSGGGTAVATQTPPDRAAASRIQAQPPGVPATSVPQPVAPARSEPSATPPAQTDRESGRAQGDNIQGGSASVAAEASPGLAPAAASVAPPPTRPTGFSWAGAEALRRERERTFRQELSIEGYFYEKRPGAAK